MSSLIVKRLWTFFAVVIAIAIVCPAIEAKPKKKGKKEEEVVAREVVWRHDLQAALAEGAALGKPVFADFYADWCGPCKKLLSDTMTDPNVIQVLNSQFIPVKLNVDVEQEAKAHYKVGGIPHLFFLRPDGSVAHDFTGYVDGATFLGQAKSALEKIGPLAPLADADRYKRSFDQATKALNKKNYRSAYRLLADIVEKGKEGIPEVDKAKAELEGITKLAADELGQIRASIDKQEYTQAAAMLDAHLATFEGTPAADEAKKYKEELESNPEVKTALRTAEANRVYADVREDIENKRYGLALSQLEASASNYSDLPIGLKLQSELDKLRSDPKLVQAVRDEEARTQSNAWLSLARTWSKNRDNANALKRARGYYQKVIDTFPGSSFSEIASKEMAKLDDPQA